MRSHVRRMVSAARLEQLSRAVAHLTRGRAARRARSVALQNRRYDAMTREIMERVLNSSSNCIDAGAFKGSILQHIVRLAPEGTHHAFEPLPHLTDDLRTRFPSAVIHECALGETEGIATFRHVTSSPAYSGFERRPWDPYDEADVQRVSVLVRRLDDVIPSDQRVDFMKIDVEGSELALLRGARETIRRWRPVVIIEVGLEPVEVYRELVASSLQVSLLDGWLEDRRALTEAEFSAALQKHFYYVAHR